jgi:hypothetical protein
VVVDVEKQEVRFGDRVIKATVPDGPRNQLVAGTWDSTAVLLEGWCGDRGDGGQAAVRPRVLTASRPDGRSPSIVESPMGGGL